jgi:hypothetical protein
LYPEIGSIYCGATQAPYTYVHVYEIVPPVGKVMVLTSPKLSYANVHAVRFGSTMPTNSLAVVRVELQGEVQSGGVKEILIVAQQNLSWDVPPFGPGGLQSDAVVADDGQCERSEVDVAALGAGTARPIQMHVAHAFLFTSKPLHLLVITCSSQSNVFFSFHQPHHLEDESFLRW